MVGGVEHVGVAEHQRAAVLRARDQAHGRLEHVHARALGADQRAGDVEAVLGQELVEVVARHAARDVGELLPDPVGDLVSELPELRVDLALPAAVGDDPFELVVRGRPDASSACRRRAAMSSSITLSRRLAGHQRVHAARVVAEHAAERAVLVGRRVRAEGQVVRARPRCGAGRR